MPSLVLGYLIEDIPWLKKKTGMIVGVMKLNHVDEAPDIVGVLKSFRILIPLPILPAKAVTAVSVYLSLRLWLSRYSYVKYWD
jgi:hypothetical protein